MGKKKECLSGAQANRYILNSCGVVLAASLGLQTVICPLSARNALLLSCSFSCFDSGVGSFGFLV